MIRTLIRPFPTSALCTVALITFLRFATAVGAEVLAISADPGPTPGDLFQGAVIDSVPSTPVYPGFDLRDAFGAQFSPLEPGRVVMADNLGSAVQKIYFHTAAPVTLAGYKLYLGSDSVGRGATHVEVSVTDAGFSTNTVLSTVDLASPYPSPIGDNSMRHVLVSDSFAPMTGQYFVLQLTPATPNRGVRVIEFDGVAPSGILAATHVDFSTAGFTGAATAQTPVNGFTYGYYQGTDSTAGVFSTAGMTGSGPGWSGDQGFSTPAHGALNIHPGAGSTRSGVVRRYTVGAGGESAFSGEIRIVGRFFDLDQGEVSGFVTIDPDGDAGVGARTFLQSAAAFNGAQATVDFDLTTSVSPGATIDFGALPGASGDYDSTGFFAWIVSVDTAVPTHLLANNYSSIAGGVGSFTNMRGVAFGMVTDGVIAATDATSFDTTPGTGFPYQHAGLLYLEKLVSGKATRFDSVRIDVTTGGDFSDTPRLYVLRHNSDPNMSNPAEDDRYARLPAVPVRTLNAVGEPAYSFDLAAFPPNERTGYGFAVVGAGLYQGTSIAVSEISATAVRVADTGVIAPQPFFVQGTNNHRYALSVVRSDWEQAEASAVIAGGHLVAINDEAENDFLGSVFGRQELFAIGLKQSPTASEPGQGFAWSNGEAVTFTNWYPGEPNNSGVGGAEEDYVFMNYTGGASGAWIDAINPGLTGNCRGIIELPTPETGGKNFFLQSISAKSNIFDAGLAASTQGGVLPPSIDLAGFAGQKLTFPQIVGVLATAADTHGPDGAHTAGRSCDLTGVGGVSGYLNGNNTPALVGVFLGVSQPAQQPSRLDFSNGALGENFATLAPALGQVFFIGDGFTSAGVAQEFIIPLGAARLYVGFPDGNNGTLYHGSPLGYSDNTGSMSLRAFVTASPTPVILTVDFPEAGGALSAGGGAGAAYTWAIIAGALPPHLHLNLDGTVVLTGDPRVNGTFTFTVQATDVSGMAQQQFIVAIADPIAPTAGLVAWWPGENAVGDIVGGAHFAVSSGSQAYVAGKVGRAFSFNGLDQSANTTTATAVMNQVPLTIEGWVKPEAHATGSINDPLPPNVICNDQRNFGGHGFGVHIYPDGSKLNIGVQGVGVDFRNIPGVTFTAGEWVHVAVVYAPGSAKTYVNGELKDTLTYTQDDMEGNNVVRLGRHNDDTGYGTRRFFKGAIDELSLYARALSGAEVAAIYLAGSGGKARYDAARDFNTVSPQVAGSLWTYGSLPAGAINTALNSFPLFPTYTVGALLRSWSGSSSVIQNYTATTYSVNGAGGTEIRVAPGQFGQGPGAGNEYSVLRWTAPQAGRYAVSATFAGVDAHGVTTDVHVYHKTTALYNDIIASEFLGNGHSYTGTIESAEDDTVDFIVGSNGNFSYDTTGSFASVVYLGPGLVAPAALTIQTAPPATSGRQWFFTATHTNDTPGLSLRVQVASANTPNTWTNIGTMTPPETGSSVWRLAANPLTLATDNYFFRVVASAPSYMEKASAAFGAEALGAGGTGAIVVLVPGQPAPPPAKLPMPPVTKFIVKVGGKTNVTATHQGTVFGFTATQSLGGVRTLPADAKVNVQYSFTPSVEASWDSLDDSRMDLLKKTRTEHTFTLSTPRIPTTDGRPNGEEAIFFRTLTSAAGRASAAGPVISSAVVPKGPYTVATGPYWRYVVSNHEASSDNSGLTAFVGDTITYHVRFVNDGDGPATNVTVTMLAPKGTTLIAPLTPGADANSTNLSRLSASRAVWVIPSVASGATVEKTITVRVTAKPYQVVKMLLSSITVKSDQIKVVQAIPERLSPDEPLNTYVTSGLSMRVRATPAHAAAGGTVDYELTAENKSADAVNSAVAVFRVPIGMSVEYLRLPDSFGDFVASQVPNPSPSSNPALDLYRVDEKQLITWQLGDIAGHSTRTLRFTLRVQFDVPTFYTTSDGVSHTTTLVANEYNSLAKTLTGVSLKAYKATPPSVNTVLSGADPVGPPLLSLLKTASADGNLADSAQPEAAPDFSIQVAGVGEVSTAFENSRITYKLRFANKAGAGTGRNVTIHDEIPDGVAFKGWIRRDGVLINSALGYTFYNRDGLEIPTGGEPVLGDPNHNGRVDRGEYTDTNGNRRYDAFEDTKFIDINLGMLAAGASGTITYDVAATSPAGSLIFSRSGGAILPKTKGGQQYEGFSITSENLLVPIAGNPNKLVSMVVAPATFSLQDPVMSDASGFAPGGAVSFEIPYRINGGDGLTFENTAVTVLVPKNFDVVAAATGHVNVSLPVGIALRPLLATAGVLSAPDASGVRKLVFDLGNLNFGREGAVSVRFKLPNPLPSDLLTAEGYLKGASFLRAEIAGGFRAPSSMRGIRSASLLPPLLPAIKIPTASSLGLLPVFPPQQARLFVGRVAPVSVERGQPFPITLFFGNVTNQFLQGGKISMKIPPGLTLLNVGPVTYQYFGGGGSRLERNEFWKTQKLADNQESLEIETLDMSSHDVASVILTVAVGSDFSGDTIEDNSLTAYTPNALGRAAPKLSIQVRSTNFFTPIGNFFGNLLGGIFGNFNAQARDALKPYEASLTADSRHIGVGGADFVHILNGTIVVPLLGGRSLVVGPSSLIAASEANILTDDGSVRVVVGDDFAPGFEISGVPNSSSLIWRPGDVIFGLRDSGSSLVAAGGGNLVAAGGLNLVAAGGLNLLDNVSGAALTAPLRPNNANMVAAGGLNLVAAGGGNIVAAGGMNLIGLDGGSLVAAGAGNLVAAGGLNLIGQDGGTLVAAGGLNMVAAGAGNLVAAGGLNLIANDLPKMIGLDGGTLVAAGGGNLTAIKLSGLIKNDGASILSHNGGTILSHNGGTLLGR